MDNLRFSTLWEPVFPFRQVYISAADRVGKYEHRTAGARSPALPYKLGLRCEWQLYGTTASRVVVFYGSGAQCGSTSAFAVLIYAPGEGHGDIA